jgi:type VI secretion system secreted protein Hcp
MAFDAFLKIEGINGESTRKGFEKHIEILSFSMGASNPVTMGSAGGGAGAGKASLSSFNCLKASDAASPGLFQACCSGKHFPKAVVKLQKSGGDSAVDYLTYEFENVFVESVQWSGSSGGDDRPTESLSLAFGKVTVTYAPQADSGTKSGAVVGSWDVQKVSA